jgi:hypothetical protein
MDLGLVQLAVKALSNELQELKLETKAMKVEISELKRRSSGQPIEKEDKKQDDALLTLAQARKILNVGRNTFLALVKNEGITPIRMNLRTIRYSKVAIMEFMERNRG